ncbi:MAG: InlB B-repeat-containing protein, partial [Candidatus Methanomethylophilaceae archaeon]
VFGEKAILTAVFEALPEAVITFVDGTSTLKSINVSDLSEKTVPSVEKTGYTFDGWFMGDVKVDPLTYTFEESVTLVAQWTPINCYVTFVAGDFVKTVPVLYGDRVQAPALPDGFEKWNFDFSVVITDDLTITAVEKAPEKPTGLADPTIKMALVVVGLFVCVLLAVIILKREDIRAGMVRKLSKAEDVKEDKKE